MTDFLSRKQRSERMSRIRGQGNRTTELRMVEILKSYGISGWRRHQPFPGTPDFAFRRERLVVFVDGCFWHGCPKCYRRPSSNISFWVDKVERNRARDRAVARLLRGKGWSVLRFWEHDLKHPDRVARRIARSLDARRG